MQYADPNMEWPEWLANNHDRDEDTQLAALREYIFRTAEDAIINSPATPEWVNKKLPKLGITQRVHADRTYELEVPVNVQPVRMMVFAANRADALVQFNDRLNHGRHVFTNVEAAADPTFVSGPEDAELDAVDPDAPTTVAGTLVLFRELVLLAVIAGPHLCHDGADRVLDEYGLAPVPARKLFTITRPADVTMTTSVLAFDEASAAKVAEWRWDDSRSGYVVSSAVASDAVTVVGA